MAGPEALSEQLRLGALAGPRRAQQDEAEDLRRRRRQEGTEGVAALDPGLAVMFVNHNILLGTVSLIVCQDLPISIPTRNTSRPPSTTCRVAVVQGESMYLWRIQAMTPSSTQTTATATMVAMLTFGIKNGRGWPSPPAVVLA